MSVESMELATVSGSFEFLDETLDKCRDSGCFQPENMSLVSGTRLNEDNPYKQPLERLVALVKSAGMELTQGEYDNLPVTVDEVQEKIDEIEKDLGDFQQEISVLQKELEYCNVATQLLEHFEQLNIPLNDLFECKFVSCRLGRLPIDGYKMLSAYADNPDVLFYTFSKDKDYYWGMYVVPKKYADEVDRIFSGLLFERLYIPEAVTSPNDAVRLLSEQTENDSKRLDEINKTLADYFSGRMDSITLLYSKLNMLSSRFELRKYANRQGDHFVMMGWVPTTDTERFSDLVSTIETVSVSITDNKNVTKLSPPIKLKNNPLVRPFEFYTKMFGVPKYGEIDPTAFVAITYTLLYGIMFADLGQGIILSIIGYWMYKKKHMDLGKLLVPCGIAGALFGTIFGSVFGSEHLLDPMFRALGFAEKPIDVMSSEKLLYVLISAVAIGVVLMIIALIINIYSCFKQHDVGAAIFGENGIVGLLIYCSAMLLVVSMLLKFTVPTALIVIFGICLPIVCIWLKEPLEKLTNGYKDWQPESWGGYVAQGFFEVFEALLSYVTNTVSFLRVGAFVLIHAGMMSVFYKLGEMAGGVGMIVLIVFGNIFVLVLEGLLVGIQGLRLEFYEMFNRFFEGSGREFSPIKY